MADIGSSTNSSSFEAKETVAEQTRAAREPSIRGANGDIIGNNYVVPKGDFGTFLGYKMPTPQEAAGEKPVSGSRVIELALQKQMQEVGMGAVKNGDAYSNIAISWGRFGNEPGRTKDMLKDAIDAIGQGADHAVNPAVLANQTGNAAPEQKLGQPTNAVKPYFDQLNKFQNDSRNDNIKYLEMQYKFQEMSKQESTISNLMKTRHDAVTRTIRGGQG